MIDATSQEASEVLQMKSDIPLALKTDSEWFTSAAKEV